MKPVLDFWEAHPVLSIFILFVVLKAIKNLLFSPSVSTLVARKLPADKCTNIMITGGAQGLGKLLASEFVRHSPPKSINLIIVDVRGDLGTSLMNDLKSIAKDARFENAHFYQANLADIAGTEALFQRITKEHGPVHILVNNHAICVGKRVDEHTIESFKLTMDINFTSYV